MRYPSPIAISLLILFFLFPLFIGCGGGSDSPGQTLAVLATPGYGGPYTGTYAGDETGTFSATIDARNALTVLLTPSVGSTVTLRGEIRADGTWQCSGTRSATEFVATGTWVVMGGICKLQGTWQAGENTGTTQGQYNPNAGATQKIVQQIPQAFCGTHIDPISGVIVELSTNGTLAVTMPAEPEDGLPQVRVPGYCFSDGSCELSTNVQGITITLDGTWEVVEGQFHASGTGSTTMPGLIIRPWSFPYQWAPQSGGMDVSVY